MERMKRWLSLALVLVLALSVMAVTAFAAGETVTVCFVPSKDWKQDNVWFAAYCWNDSGSQWVRLTQDGFCYTGEIPVEYTNIIFARMASNQTEMNWDNRWTQTGDLVLDASNPCFVKGSGWEGSGGTWTTCPPAFDYYLAGYLNGSDVGINNSQNKAEYLFTNGYLDVTFTQDSYLCMSVQYDGVVIGNLMTASYVSSGDSTLMQITGSEKFRVPAGTYRLVMTRHEDDSVTLGLGCLHDKTHHDGVEATCTDDGTVEYWSCDICGKNYADQYGVTELTELTIPAKNHNYSDNGFCTNVNGGVLCDAYEPAIRVTDENYAELGLTADYVGYYAITNAGNLYWFADKVDSWGMGDRTTNTDSVVLTNDITVNPTTVTAGSVGLREWNPIGYYSYGGHRDNSVIHSFNGIFDGNYKTVSGLYLDDDRCEAAGLIAITGTGALVKNVTLTNSYMKGLGNIGGIVSRNEGTVTGCINTANIRGIYHVGGVVGLNYGVVEQCGNSETDHGYATDAGGIVGWNYGMIRNCWNTGMVTGTGVGGIAGVNQAGAEIENCWFTGSMTGGDPGGIVSQNLSGATVRNCYSIYSCPVRVDEGTVVDVESKTNAQFTSGEVAYLLRTRAAGTNVWGQDLDNGKPVQSVPTFTGADVYYVPVDCAGNMAYSNTDGSKAVHNYDDNGFCINPVGDGVLCDAYEPAVLVTNENYAELGLTADYVGYYAITNAGNLYWFAEKVDNENDTYGSANVVLTKDITVNSGTVTAESTGLREWNPIGYAVSNEFENGAGFDGIFDGNGKTVSGLYFNDENASFVGLIAKTGSNALVKGVILTNSYLSGNNEVGGIVGDNKGSVTACINNATITGSGTMVGGIAGHNSGNITDCVNHAAITGLNQIGGISGASYGTVELCGNAGAVTATSGSAGGVVGENYNAAIRNCWNTADVSAGDNAGGITSRVAATPNPIENCWSTGTVASTRSINIGGLVGYVDGIMTIRNCYTTMNPAIGPKFRFIDDPIVTDVETKTLDQFASGEVAYLLRTRVAEGTDNVWGQDLDNGKPKQDLPTFTGADVYYGYTSCADTEPKYTNDPNVSADPIPHNWDYTADGASITGTCLNECGTDGGKVTLVLDGSTVYDGTEKVVVAEGTLTGIATLPVVTYEGNRVNIGTFTAYLTLEDGTQAKLEVTITAKELTPTVEGLEDSYEYTGEAIKPEITVKDGDKVLTEGTDYDVTYGENTNVGEGTVTVTLKGDYEGQLKQTFDITPKKTTPTVEGV